jgi:lambda repressor-like predicted transcriptional regulator
MYRSGLLLREVATKLGIHRSTLAEYFRRDGIDLRRRPMRDNEAQRAAKLYEDGQSLFNVGQQLGFSGGTIRSALQRQGVELRDPDGRYSSDR